VHRLRTAILSQRGHLFPWLPVALACGIGAYFAWPWEPPIRTLWACATAGIALALSARWAGALAGPLIWGAALIAFGFALAAARSHWVAGPVLDWRYYGPVQGRVVGIDRSASDAVRLTLDRVVLARVAPADTPRRVRVSLHGAGGIAVPEPGAVVQMTAHLSGSGGPVEPGGFDFRRHAWFLKLGAVGYTRAPVVLWHAPEGGVPVFALRRALSARVQTAIPGEPGAFAAAVIAGDRSGMGQESLTALRHANLAHLLAISGLHMGLLAGFVFAVLRTGLALIPTLALRWPVKKIAAVCALVVAAGYLALSGGNVATERAFVMVAVALVAVLLDRRALSLRAVAVAALIVLVLRPEALMGPGFQMSFAATTALVAAFAALRDRGGLPGPRWLQGGLSLLISSAVAGAATAPIAAAHFNLFSHYGLAANLVSVPLMGLLVIPAAVVGVLLMPLGFDAVPFWAMEQGLRWILFVAQTVSAWPGAVGHVVAPSGAVLPLLALGGLMVMLWQGRGRWVGLLPMAAAMAVWMQSARPPVLVAPEGALVGVMTAEGRALSKAKGAGFVAGVWLENDGDGADQVAGAARWPGEGRMRILGDVIHVQGKTGSAAFTGCAAGQIAVFTEPAPAGLPCLVLGPEALKKTGAVSLSRDGDGGWHVTKAMGSNRRLWEPPAPRPTLGQ